MARLLGIRRLEPVVDFRPSESNSNLTAFNTETPECFQNPSFQHEYEKGEEWSRASPRVSISFQTAVDQPMPSTNSNNNTIINNDQSNIKFTSSDSGILISPPSNQSVKDDASSVGGKSLDSGVYEVLGRVSLPQNGLSKQYSGGSGKHPNWTASLRRYSVRSFKDGPHEEEETLLAICVQVFIPFLIAGVGTCGAGIVLDYVETWKVFIEVSELFILVPTLLGLKGNLEMTLASRVSTQANCGKLDTWKDQWRMSWGNMSLILCQATVMGFLAAAIATCMTIAKSGFNLSHALILCASSLFTAVMASLVLGTITLIVVVASHKCKINPDNVATPIAASLGDVTTLGILAAISNYLYQTKDDFLPPGLIISIFMLLIPVWVYFSFKNSFVRQVLYTGWIPVIMALGITSVGGYILEQSVSQFKGISIFQPVINGVAGNIVAVQTSRISTYFHQHSEKPGSRPPDGAPICISPFTAFFGKSVHSRSARILMGMVIPGHLLFGYGITWIKGGDTPLTPTFLPIYLLSAFVQIALLLYIAQCLVQVLWRLKIDPDNSAIPLLTALGDLSGMSFLTLAFYMHRKFVLQT